MKPPEDEIQTVRCSGAESHVTVATGERFRITFHRHVSVGEDAEFVIRDPDLISHEKTTTEYLHPERLKPGFTGGDAERGTWLFRAMKPGTTTIVIRRMFRGDVDSECVLHVTIE